MVNKDFCLSSYMAFRYIWKDCVDFAEGFQHKNFRPVEDKDRIPVRTSEDIDREIQKQFDELYQKYDNIGILLSGGMDSANLAAYLKPGCAAFFEKIFLWTISREIRNGNYGVLNSSSIYG